MRWQLPSATVLGLGKGLSEYALVCGSSHERDLKSKADLSTAGLSVPRSCAQVRALGAPCTWLSQETFVSSGAESGAVTASPRLSFTSLKVKFRPAGRLVARASLKGLG